MTRPMVVISAVLATSVSFASQATFKSVQDEFQGKVLSLLSEEEASRSGLYAKIATFANETFGAHPDLMRKEAERRFRALPQFPPANLAAYVEHKSWDKFPLPPVESGWVWLTFGWDPEKLADTAKKTILSRQLGVEAYGRLALLNVCCPDKVYRLGEGKIPDLVVDSLGDLFVVEVEMTKVGACKPVSIRWMKKKEAPATEPR